MRTDPTTTAIGRALFFATFRSMPTANAEGTCGCRNAKSKAPRVRSIPFFYDATLAALAVRRRHGWQRSDPPLGLKLRATEFTTPPAAIDAGPLQVAESVRPRHDAKYSCKCDMNTAEVYPKCNPNLIWAAREKMGGRVEKSIEIYLFIDRNISISPEIYGRRLDGGSCSLARLDGGSGSFTDPPSQSRAETSPSIQRRPGASAVAITI